MVKRHYKSNINQKKQMRMKIYEGEYFSILNLE